MWGTPAEFSMGFLEPLQKPWKGDRGLKEQVPTQENMHFSVLLLV
jgi:hypothetical protein